MKINTLLLLAAILVVRPLNAEPTAADAAHNVLAMPITATNKGDNQLIQVANTKASVATHSLEMTTHAPNPFRDELLPVPKSAVFKMDGFYLWDPSIIKVGDTYHLFVSRWPESNGMNGWMKSDVVRATSKSLFGPYVFAGIVIDPAHHPWAKQGIANPKVMRVGNRFLLHYLGIPKWQTGFAFADNIEGPWTVLEKPILPTINASLLIKPDGKLYAVGKFKINSQTPNKWDAFMRAYEADDIMGPYRVVADNGNRLPNEFQLEDPAIWWENNQFNLLCTDWQGKITGINKAVVYYTSKDGVHYQLFSDAPVWSQNDSIPVEVGEGLKVDRVERPEVYLDEAGKVTAILAAVQPAKAKAYIVIRPVNHFPPNSK